MFRLSICIPVYNRANYLKVLINSILIQIDCAQCEIVISDNASNDGTQEVMRRYASRYNNITVAYSDENQGADKNYLRVIELAKGDYCWLMGSDDALLPGAVDGVLRQLDAYPNISGMSVNHLGMSPDFQEALLSTISDTKFTVPQHFTKFSSAAVAIGDYWGYLSGQIVHRMEWGRALVSNDTALFYNAYVHVYIIMKMLQDNGEWLYDPVPRVAYRSGNDSFLEKGALQRMMIDVRGYAQLYGYFFSNDEVTWRKCMNKIAVGYVAIHLRTAKINGSRQSFFSLARKMITPFYRRLPQFWVKTFPMFFIPGSAWILIRKLYRVIYKDRSFSKHQGKNKGAIDFLRRAKNATFLGDC